MAAKRKVRQQIIFPLLLAVVRDPRPDSEIRDPGWKKIRIQDLGCLSQIRDPGIFIRDPAILFFFNHVRIFLGK
jgi:hypothetical protein